MLGGVGGGGGVGENLQTASTPNNPPPNTINELHRELMKCDAKIINYVSGNQ